ncbi:phosphatase PAP2 family protein [Lysobacter sp. P5_B9]
MRSDAKEDRRFTADSGIQPGILASRQFYARHLLIPLVAFALTAFVLAWFDIDRWWAGKLYAWQGHAWIWKSSFVTETLVHTLGRMLSVAAWFVVLGLWIRAMARQELSRWRRPLAYLLLATAMAALTVAWMKSWTNVNCPWDLTDFGGKRVYHGLFAARPAGPRGECFPAAHASAGYCWLSLYFFFLATRPQLRWLGFGIAIGFGLLFGFVQQLRGAHFLSHDLWALAVCWLVTLAVYVMVLKGKRAPEFDHDNHSS